jgi:hypothetical protein
MIKLFFTLLLLHSGGHTLYLGDDDDDDNVNPFWQIRIFRMDLEVIGVVIGTIAAALAALARMWVNYEEKQKQLKIEGYFEKLKTYAFAHKVGDTSGLGTGRYKLTYPKLVVAEFVFDVRGCALQYEDTLLLKNGDQIQFYNPDEVHKEEQPHEEIDVAPVDSSRNIQLPW